MLRRLMVLVVLACIIGGGSGGARAQGSLAGRHVWKLYTNVRFQYAICYPEDLLIPQGESENGDGERFLANDGAQLIVFGQNNALGKSLKNASTDSASRLAGVSGRVTYKVLKANWFVVSGRNRQAAFYAKTCYSHDQFKSFELAYELSMAGVYEPLIARLTACFADLAH